MIITRNSFIFPSICRTLRGSDGFRVASPQASRAIAWGYHSARQLRRLGESFVQLSIWLRPKPRYVSSMEIIYPPNVLKRMIERDITVAAVR